MLMLHYLMLNHFSIALFDDALFNVAPFYCRNILYSATQDSATVRATKPQLPYNIVLFLNNGFIAV